MVQYVLLFLLGLVLLIKGGDWFVDGSVGIARWFHLSEILIGATIVSIGTTLPEVMVSATSAVQGQSSISYGNAIGSIICNTALIAAITIAVRPGEVHRRSLKLPVIFFFAAAIFYTVIAYTMQAFSRWVGIALLVIFLAYIALSVYFAKHNPESELLEAESLPEEPTAGKAETPKKKGLALFKDLAFLIVGAALIAVGAKLLVDNGTGIAKGLGVPEKVIALTFVALGTSLPELVTAITALIKGHNALSLGNIIGANLFNLVLVSGVSITLRPFDVPTESVVRGMNTSFVVDLPLMLGVMLILTVPALLRGKLSRWQGILLLCLYAAFCTFQFVV